MTLSGICAVSYTHLDVYKRQAAGSGQHCRYGRYVLGQEQRKIYGRKPGSRYEDYRIFIFCTGISIKPEVLTDDTLVKEQECFFLLKPQGKDR